MVPRSSFTHAERLALCDQAPTVDGCDPDYFLPTCEYAFTDVSELSCAYACVVQRERLGIVLIDWFACVVADCAQSGNATYGDGGKFKTLPCRGQFARRCCSCPAHAAAPIVLRVHRLGCIPSSVPRDRWLAVLRGDPHHGVEPDTGVLAARRWRSLPKNVSRAEKLAPCIGVTSVRVVGCDRYEFGCRNSFDPDPNCPKEEVAQDNYYVANIEDFTLLIDHSVRSPTVEALQVGYLGTCSSLYRACASWRHCFRCFAWPGGFGGHGWLSARL